MTGFFGTLANLSGILEIAFRVHVAHLSLCRYCTVLPPVHVKTLIKINKKAAEDRHW